MKQDKTLEEQIYVPKPMPENNKPDMTKPVKSALHGRVKEKFYQDFYVCVPKPNHYPEGCICEFTDVQAEPLIEWFADALQTQREEIVREAKMVCLGAVTSLGYALKWENYEIKRLNQELNDGLQSLTPEKEKTSKGTEIVDAAELRAKLGEMREGKA